MIDDGNSEARVMMMLMIVLATRMAMHDCLSLRVDETR